MVKPFLSVLIDTYNHERFIEQAILSVLAQDVAEGEREIIVVDDGSSDRTPEIVRRFEPRVRLIRKTNGGQASAFNVGIPECSGVGIAFLDGDDWWAPGKLRTVADLFAKDVAVGLIGHGIVESFENGVERIVAPEKAERFRLDSLAAARTFRLRKTYLGTSRMALRASVAREILPAPMSLVIEADEYLFTMAGAVSDVVILREALCHYRLHSESLYLAAGSSKSALRRKQAVHEALAEALRRELKARDVLQDAVDCVTEIVQLEGDQIRLMLDGGAPWETVRTENRIYEILHRNAPQTHRMFRALTMVPAFFLPPRWFYRTRSWVSSHRWFGEFRRKYLPMPW
jgi:glycosyltransferase involved in cell wall biosynthesis